MSTRRSSGQTTITTNLEIGQIHNIASSVNAAVKNAVEAKSYLATKGWIAPGETASMDVLARVLFATMIHSKNLPQAASSSIAAVAYLLTAKQETGILENLTDHISLHIKDTIDSITSDLHVKLNQHIQAASETAKKQSDLTDKLIKTQEQLEESTNKVLATPRTYSQVAAAAPTHAPTPTPRESITQIRIRNREEIKKRQVLIEFDRTQDLQLENMSDTVLARKAKDAINTVWVISPDPKPEMPKIKAATLLRNGGLLIELDTAEAADWLCDEANRKKILDNIGSGASIKNRTYQVIVQFIPIQFNPENDDSLRHIESTNGLQPGTIMKAEWIKPIKDRREGQRVATARFYFKNAKTANTILSTNAYIYNKKVIPKKPRKEPIRCLKCQRFGHERRHCMANGATCARCARQHETEECITPHRDFKCTNCEGRHPSYDRECPRFTEKCDQLNRRCPENGLAFYPTDEPWSWATADTHTYQEEQGEHHDTQQLQQWTPPPNNATGTNNTPLGPRIASDAQPQPDPPQ